MLHSLVLCLPFVLGGSIQETSAQQARQQPTENDLALLIGDFEHAILEHRKQLYGATDEERVAMRAHRPRPEEYAKRFFDLAERGARTSIAESAMLWLAPKLTDRDLKSRALGILRRDHIASERMIDLCPDLRRTLRDGGAFLAELMEKSPHHEVRGQACYNLAMFQLHRSGTTRRLQLLEGELEHDHYLQMLGQGVFDQLEASDFRTFERHAETLLEEVRKEFAALESPAGRLGVLAERALWQIRNLSIGKTAPEVVGKGLRGEELKLSGFRGKIVVLDFQGHSFGACRAQYPHQRELIERLEGEPFVFVTVSSDTDSGLIARVREENGLAGPCFFDGGSIGPIATRWNVTSWPTTYVLDANGVIRYEGARGGALDRAVDQLLRELKE